MYDKCDNKLPQGWVECQLGEVFETSSGGTPKRGNPEYYQNGTIPWLKSGELNNSIIYSSEEFITEEGLNNSSAKIFPKGSLLIALYGATVGKLGILDFDSATNQAVCCIYQNAYYNRDFLFYYLLFKKEYLVNQGKGGAQPNISQEIVKSLIIPFPPLKEQKQIVEKIESEFAKIDEGLEHLKNAKEQIKQYRQSVLKSAFEGKLYKTTEWIESELINLCKSISAGGDRPEIYSETPTQDCKIPIYSNGIKDNGLYGYTNLARIKEPAITVSARGTIGFVCARYKPYFPIVRLISVIPELSLLDIEFLKYFLSFVVPKGEGSSIPQLTVPNFKKYSIILPTLEEQKKIVEEIEKRFAVANEVEKAVEDNIEKAKQLKQSILKKAFEGRLVPQDPNDEPATKLLEKIKQERKENDRK